MEVQCDVLKNDIDIYYCSAVPDNPKAIILLLHGYGNHYGYFEDLIKVLYENGYGTYAYDHRGHGRSTEERGYIAKFELMVSDVDNVVEYIKSKHKDVPIFTYGHSMGGLISFMYGVDNNHKIEGQIFEAAALGEITGSDMIPEKVFKDFKEKSPKGRFYPIIRLRSSRSRERLKSKRSDKYCLKYGTFGLAYEFVCRGIRKSVVRFSDYTLPCLILHGEKDKIVPYENSIKFYFDINSVDKDIEIYPLMNHELIFEPEKIVVINKILKWLDSKTLNK